MWGLRGADDSMAGADEFVDAVGREAEGGDGEEEGAVGFGGEPLERATDALCFAGVGVEGGEDQADADDGEDDAACGDAEAADVEDGAPGALIDFIDGEHAVEAGAPRAGELVDAVTDHARA